MIHNFSQSLQITMSNTFMKTGSQICVPLPIEIKQPVTDSFPVMTWADTDLVMLDDVKGNPINQTEWRHVQSLVWHRLPGLVPEIPRDTALETLSDSGIETCDIRGRSGSCHRLPNPRIGRFILLAYLFCTHLVLTQTRYHNTHK